MKYARIINDVAVDVSAAPMDEFHPLLAAEFESVPDEVEHGWRLDDGVWTAPPPVPAPPPSPPPAPIVPELSFPQLLYGLVTEQWITPVEADAWLVQRVLPAPFNEIIAQMPDDQQILAKARALQPTEVIFTDPLVQQLGQLQNKTPEEMATFFRTYAAA